MAQNGPTIPIERCPVCGDFDAYAATELCARCQRTIPMVTIPVPEAGGYLCVRIDLQHILESHPRAQRAIVESPSTEPDSTRRSPR